MSRVIPTALTIAGSDSSGGAGIQADLKTFSYFKVHGMSAITSLTAQNTLGILSVSDVDPEFVSQQIHAVLSDIPPDAVKTGMLSTSRIVEAVAAELRRYSIINLVVDPVMIAKSGTPLLRNDAIDVFRKRLLPLALIATPNLDEAGVLTGREVRTREHMKEAALRIHELGPKYVLIKGGHLEGDPLDILFDGAEFTMFRAKRIATTDSHGTGCVLSAAIAANLARGRSVIEAVGLAKDLVTDAIRHGLRIGGGHGPCDPVGIEP
jgi:hydroxymethylpyrimidine/phosphomethylpyrimidine kinase